MMNCDAIAIAIATEVLEDPKGALEPEWPYKIDTKLGKGAGTQYAHINHTLDIGSPREEVWP